MTHEQAVTTLASERYLLEEMTGPERETFEEHYFSCVACAEDVRTGGLMRDGARAGLLEEQGDDRARNFCLGGVAPEIRPRRWYQSAAIPWAVAATLAVVAGYQASRRRLAAHRAAGPRAGDAAAREPWPGTRIPIGPGSAAMTLAVDASSAVAGAGAVV